MSLQYSQYTQGLDKAGQEALSFAQKNQLAMEKATAATDEFFTKMHKNAIALVAAYIGVTQVLDRVTGAFDKLGKLSDMAQQTGASIENLSRILKVAAATKFDATEVENGLIKLAKGMATVDSETNKVHKALDALGISATDSAGKMRDPGQVMIEIAQKLAGYNDSANKAALANDLITKSGVKMLPFFNDIAEHIDDVSATSKEATKRVEELSERFGFMRVKIDDLFQSFVIDLLPTMERMADAFSESSKGASTFGIAAKVVSVIMETLVILGSEVSFVMKGIGNDIGGAAAQMMALAKLDFAGFRAITKAVKEDGITARIEHDKFIAAVINGDKKMQALKLRPKEDGKDLDYLSGREKKDVVAKISDYQKLTQEIAKLTAEQQKRLTLGRELTSSEKRLADLIADRATGAKKLTEREFELVKAQLAGLSALEKQVAANEKLKKVREEIAGIVTSAQAANAEHIANLELENSLVGKSALQQQLLRSEYQANLALKRQFADIDKATKGMTDPAAVAKLRAESNARVEAIKEEARAKIKAKFEVEAKEVFAVTKDKAITQAMGQMVMPDEVAKRTAAAQAEHAAALSRIADLDVIRGRIEIEAKLKADIAASDAVFADEARQQSVGRDVREKETHERIANFQESETSFGATRKQFEEAALALLDDKVLSQQRGMEINSANAALSRQILTDEADAKMNSLGISKNQLAFDNANLKLQQQLWEIQQFSADADEEKKLGLAYQIEKQGRLLVLLTQKKNLDQSQVGSGEELVKINKELLDLNEKIAKVDPGRADKAKLEADSAARQVKEAQILADTAQKTINANFVQQFESDFHGSMLRLLEQGKTNWSAMMNGWKNSFKVNVVDYIYKQFAKPFVFKAIMSLAGAVGANELAAAAGKEADAGLMGKVSTTDWMTVGKSLWDGMSNGFASFGKLVETGLSKAGMSAANAGTIGGYAGSAASGLAGISIGTFIAGDKTLLGLNGMATSTIGSLIGYAFSPLMGPLIGGVLGGLASALFGIGPKKYEPSTVKGNFSGQGFEGGLNTHWTQKGGVFRSNRSGDDTSALTDPAQQFLNSFVGKSGLAFAKLITVSGDAARSVDGWSFAINRALLTEEDFTKLFGDMADSMGTHVLPELEKFRAKGENLADTAVRLADEYIITDSIFRMMGFTTAETGIASLGMRDSLIQLMGGIQQTSATMDAYYKNYFTADEQQANSLRQVTDQFRILGVEVPKTRFEFRKMADVLVRDVTPAGQALFAGFMKLNPAFAAVTQSTEDLAQALIEDLNKTLQEAIALQARRDTLEIRYNTLQGNSARALMLTRQLEREATDESNRALLELVYGQEDYNASLDRSKKAVTEAFAGIQRAVARERDVVTKAYQSSLDKVASSVTSVTTAVDKLKALSGALRQSVADIRAPGRAEAQAQILTALTIAKAGGGLPTAESLSGALQSIAQPSEQLFSTFLDYQTDQIKTAQDIAALADMADAGISVQDKQLGVLEATRKVLEGTQAETMSRLDGILARGQSQLDGMNAVETSVFSVATAVNGMTNAVNAYMNLATGNGMSAVGLPSASIPSTNGLSPTQIGMGITIQDGWLPFSGTASPAVLSPPTLAGMHDLINRRLALRGMPPGFASGGMHTGGARVVGENGPEIEWTGPSRISSNSESKKLVNNEKLEVLVKELKEAVVHLNIDTNINAIKTKKTADILEKWETSGVAPERATL